MPINTLKAQQQKNGGIRKETTSGPPFGCRESGGNGRKMMFA